MIKPLSISGFYENLPDAQVIEDNFKDIIRKNYMKSGFLSIETPVVERLEILTSKGGDDNEIYGLHRISGEKGDDASLGLRFDLTVPLARYVAQYEGVLIFPFKRQQISKVYRGERPQRGRFREFYQADIDIIGNGKLPLFADVEVITTIYNSLKELDFGDFVININNKKLLEGFLSGIGIKKIVETIGVIDKKDKVRSIIPMLEELFLSKEQIELILSYIKVAEEKNSKEILDYYKSKEDKNDLLIEGINELEYVYNNLINLGIDEKFIKINPSISRGLNYYTGTVYETFLVGAENMGSISSGGRYENLCSNFTKNNYPGVGGSIGISRLISVLNTLGKINTNPYNDKKVMVVNSGEEYLQNNLKIVKNLRNAGIITELYLDPNVKMQKQFKYANNKNIKYVIVCMEDEIKKGVVQIKNLEAGEQEEVKMENIVNYLK